MLERTFTNPLIRPADLAPSREGMRVVGVFNPGVAEHDGQVVIVARVVEAPVDVPEDVVGSPRLDHHGTLAVDHLPADEYDLSDRRTVFRKADGLKRLRFLSHFRVFFSEDGKSVTPEAIENAIVIQPEGPYETFGIEDPRITRIGDLAYITYVAVSPRGVCTSLMSTTDFKSFHRHGIVFAPDNKDVVLFPERLLGDYIALHRPMPAIKFSEPAMWVSRSQNLLHWGGHERLVSDGDEGVSVGLRYGGGTPPIRTRDGWLMIYHVKHELPDAADGGKRFRYVAHAMLLHPDNPSRVLGASVEPVMKPEEAFERRGFVDDVVFPTGIVEREGVFYVYYGAADEVTAVCGFDRVELLEACSSAEPASAG
ncbi:MAG: glycosylase [Planctomycetota bacterium]